MHGSAITSKQPAGPRDIVVRLIEANPSATEDELFPKFERALQAAGADCQMVVNRYYWAGVFPSLKRAALMRSVAQPERNAARQRVQSNVQRAAERRQETQIVKAKIVSALMDLTLPPRGKRLADATFGECAAAGGWYAQVAKCGKPNEIVGQVLSETDLREIVLAPPVQASVKLTTPSERAERLKRLGMR